MLKKIMSCMFPLFLVVILSITNNFIFSLIPFKFFKFTLIGLLIGIGIAALNSLSLISIKQYGYFPQYKASAIVIACLLVYQFFTYTGDVKIPALNFLNIVDPTTIIFESCILGYLALSLILFLPKKTQKKKQQ